MFLHYLLTRDDEELTSKVLKAQMNDPIKGDWVGTVKQDLSEFSFPLNFEVIKLTKKEAFKKMVKNACMKVTLAYLLKEKEDKSKMINLEYKELKIQKYLTSDKLSKRKQKIIFKWRTRMIEVGNNFGQTKPCPTCQI